MSKENEPNVRREENNPPLRPRPQDIPFESPQKGAYEPKKPIKPPKVAPPTPPPNNN